MPERFIDIQGVKEPHYGYGRMHEGLRNAVAQFATIHEQAEVAVHVNAPNAVKSSLKGQTRVCFTMWETDTLHDAYVAHLSAWDIILVPCEHNRALFAQHHPDVRVSPLGVDTSFFIPSSAIPRKTQKVRFLAGGSHWLRKGLPEVVEAFRKLKHPNAELVIKCTPYTIGGVPKINDDSITVIEDVLTPIEERKLYRSADMMIAAARGEGWGMMPLQAMCMGIPVAMTDNTGHSEFSHLATKIIEDEVGPAYSEPWYLDGNWHNPKVESILEAMEWFVDNREQARQIAKGNSGKAQQFSWENAAKSLLRVVPSGGILDTTEKEVVAPDLVPLVVVKRVRADIGKHTVDLAPGVTHMVPVNVRDVIRSAGFALK